MNIKSKWNNANKGLLAILAVLLVATISTLIFLASTLLGVQQLVDRGGSAAGKVMVLQDVMINLQDAQRGARGYVLTGDEHFLDPYQKALDRLPADMRIIRSSTQLALTTAETKQLEALVDESLVAMKQIVDVRSKEGFEPAQALIATKASENTMINAREEIDTISSQALQNIGPMQEHSLANITKALWVGLAMGILVLGTCGAVLWNFRRAILQERALEGTKNEFLSLASHQLRTPATNVKQYLSLVMEGYMGDINDKQRQALGVAYKNNEAEIKIMNDLLDVAKLNLNRIQLHKKITNVMSIARAAVRDHRPRIEEKNQSIVLKGSKVVMANVDKEYVSGIMNNLLDNAVKYSHEGSKIVMTVEREQDEICITVKDTGVGIRKRDFSKLFNKFSRLANEFSANSEGSGLGLYWVKQVVDLHGGRVDVVSKEGLGSTFRIYLPVR